MARDGTVEAACRIIDAPNTGLTLPKGLGTRHWAAAAITNVTKALAVVVSQSTGTVRLFQNGEIILRIAPMRHDRAMKWQDSDSEPPEAVRERELIRRDSCMKMLYVVALFKPTQDRISGFVSASRPTCRRVGKAEGW